MTTVPTDRMVCGLLNLMTQQCEPGGGAPLALIVESHPLSACSAGEHDGKPTR
jgi:hypothetical protein